MGKKTVDDFVKTKVLPELQPIVAMIRELMKDCAPNANKEALHDYIKLALEFDAK